MQFAEKMHPQKMGFRDYIEALEDERIKIQVFLKELPFSYELVTQAIEACKQQLSGTTTEYNLNGQSECSEEPTSTEEGPVFEEFIPMKKRASPDNDDEEEDDEQHSHKHKIPKDNNTNSTDNDNNNNNNKKKPDWLRSAQLWNPEPPPTKEDVPRKASVVEVKRNGGAFQPFHREEKICTVVKANASNGKAPSSPQVPASATSSTGPVTGDNVVGSSKREEKGQTQRKQRRCWSQELHKRFLHALQQLGGADSATPKQIRELMKVDDLTNDEVKSHLQKFRLHNRRPSPSPMIHNNANSQATPLFLVGNIFVQPPEYATVATSTASAELTTVTAPTRIYTPMASHPPAISHTHPSIKEFSEHSDSEERANHSEGALHSNTLSSSSSTHTTTTSPGC